MDLLKQLRETVGSVLRSGEAEVAVGYGAGTIPLSMRPILVKTEAETVRLVLEPFRSGGIALYVQRYLKERRSVKDFDPSKAGKVAVMARPCDVKAIVNYIKEKQFSRDDVYIIGMNCPGVCDREKIFKHIGPYEIASSQVENGNMVIKSNRDKQVSIALKDVLSEICSRCIHRTPPVADVVIGEAVPVPDVDPFEVVRQHESKTVDERWEWFAGELDRCIRCRACRQACPMCYCKTCFADQTNPAWIGQTAAPADVIGFHIGRLFHMAGRCVDCGLCEAACPMNIPLTVLNRKLDQVVFDMFGYQSGMDIDQLPPLSTYNPEDPDKGFL